MLPPELRAVAKSVTDIRMNLKEWHWENYWMGGGSPPEKYKLEFEIMGGLVLECYRVAYARMFLGVSR